MLKGVSNCVKELSLSSTTCILPETALRWVKPEILLIQSTQDKWQKNCIWSPNENGDCKKDEKEKKVEEKSKTIVRAGGVLQV